MRKPVWGESNLGALVGAIIGAVGGLFAVGIAPAIISKNLADLLATPILGFLGWLVSCPAGWMLGGQIGPRLESILGFKPAGVSGEIIGGLVPVTMIGLWGWYMVAPH